MIWTAIVGLLLSFLAWVLDLFPSWSSPSFDCGAPGGCAAFGGVVGRYMSYIQGWVNVSLLVTCIGIVVAVFVAVVSVRAIVFLYEKIPFKAS